jgi:hypothetical protein
LLNISPITDVLRESASSSQANLEKQKMQSKAPQKNMCNIFFIVIVFLDALPMKLEHGKVETVGQYYYFA